MEEIKNNKERSRFEWQLPDGEFAYIDYCWSGEKMAIMHTFVPPAYEGKGIAAQLASFALEQVMADKIPVLIYCPYVRAYLQRHTEIDEKLKEMGLK